MRSNRYTTEAIILSKRDYSEADRIITAFTKEYGKLAFIAKGVRSLKSKKRGALEIFHQLRLGAAKGHDLDIITEVEIIDTRRELKVDLRKMTVGYFMCEVVLKLTDYDGRSNALYNTLEYYLEKIGSPCSLQKARRDFIYDVLVDLGFWPEGKEMADPDIELTEILERKLNTPDIARKILQ